MSSGSLTAGRAVDIPTSAEHGTESIVSVQVRRAHIVSLVSLIRSAEQTSIRVNSGRILPNGITPGLPSNRTGLPFVDIAGGFNIGNGWEGELPQVGNSFQLTDNLSWVKGNHTIKFGADIQRNRFDQTLYYNVSGNFTFDSSGTMPLVQLDNYPGYFLGLVDTYSQGSAQRENIRNTGLYLFAQDSWKIKSNLTLNYGLRWELDTPLADALGPRADLPSGREQHDLSLHQYSARLLPDGSGVSR